MMETHVHVTQKTHKGTYRCVHCKKLFDPPKKAWAA